MQLQLGNGASSSYPPPLNPFSKEVVEVDHAVVTGHHL